MSTARSKSFLCLVFLLFALTACGKYSKSDVSAVPESLFNPQYPTQETYIAVGDVLDIKFYYNPELNTKVIVPEDGNISLPLFSRVYVFNKSVTQLHAELMQHYSKEFVDPDILINVEKPQNAQVFVTGEVQRGGPQALVANMTVGQMLAQVGVNEIDGDINGVLLVRKTSPTNYVAYLLNADFATGPDRDVYLAAGDLLVVPRNTITLIGDAIQKYVRDVIPPNMSIYYDTTRNFHHTPY